MYTFHEVCILNHTGMTEKPQIKIIMVLELYLPIKLTLLWLFFSCGFKLLFSIILFQSKGLLVASPVGQPISNKL